MRSLETIRINKKRLDKKITITEIAKHLGCSYSNVWFNFNGDKKDKEILSSSEKYINNKIVKGLDIDRDLLNTERKEKNITLQSMANDLGVRADGIWQVLAGNNLNLPLLLRVKDYINKVDVRFANLKKSQFNRTSLKKLGFSEWEINRIL